MTKNLGEIRFSIATDEFPVVDFPIDLFTKDMNIKPTQAFKVGDEYSRNQKVYKRTESVWILESEFKDDNSWYEYSDLFNIVIEPLRKREHIIKTYKERYSLTIFIRIYFHFIDAQTPGVHLDKKIIQFANNIGAEFEIFIDNEIEC